MYSLKNTSLRTELKILNFNIEGLSRGLEDPTLINLIYEHDICILTETWKKDESKINLPGYWDFSQVRPKHRKAGRHSGGISVLCKEKYRPGLKILHTSEGFIWVKLESTFFSLVNDLFICATYIPPQYTTNISCKKIDYFSVLNECIMKYSALGNIIIAGDMNARTKSQCSSHQYEIPEIEALYPSEFRTNSGASQRVSNDTKGNAYGNQLIQLCKNFNLKIANGSVLGDRTGSFTCHTNRGSSVVDYFICDPSVFNLISSMIVLPPQFNSVHSPLSLSLECDFDIQKANEKLSPSPQKNYVGFREVRGLLKSVKSRGEY